MAGHAHVLVNVQGPGQEPVGTQPLHMDLPPSRLGYVVILSLSDDFTLLVCPGSHNDVRRRWCSEHLSEEAFAATMSSSPLVRLKIPRGWVVVMDGNLVHAGDAGKPSSASPRVHWYIQGGRPVDNTVPAESLGRLIYAKLGGPDS